LQLFVLGFCCSGVGLVLRFLLPNEFSLLHKVLFSLLGGAFLVVLVAQNLVYLGVPVRISAWLLLGAALVQVWLSRRNFLARIRTLYANADIRTLAVMILLIILFHGIVPIRQGLEWYYGKGHDDQLNCVLTAEFLKEEPYGTSGKEIALRPWLVKPVGDQDTAKQMAKISEPEEEMIALKKEKIGQSVLMAEISVWSGTNAKGGYAAAVIFSITLLAICLYVLLRETARPLHGWVRRAGGTVSPCCHSTLTRRISVGGIHPFCFPVSRNHAPAPAVECAQFYSIFQPHPCLRSCSLSGNCSNCLLHFLFGCDARPAGQVPL
jgi:hypothetical protein